MGGSAQQVDRAPPVIPPGTLMQKAIPPRLVEPYLTGRRSVIAGFVYRVADTALESPADYYDALDLGYADSEFSPDMPELYLLRWRAVGKHSYEIPYAAALGGDWAMKPPFTGTGYTSARARPVPEFYTDPIPVPVGAELLRVRPGVAEAVARFEGQIWLRPPAEPPAAGH
jgi:hypothetical protein